MVPRKQAGHMTCARPLAERQILFAMRASSTHDPQRAFGVILICRGLGSLIYAKLDLRLYRPWAEVLDGRWKFPGAEPEN